MHRTRFLREVLSLLLFFAPVVAQTDANKAQVNGTVTDPNGAVVPVATFAAGGTTRDPFANANPLSMGADFKNPRALQMGFGAESEIMKGFTVGAQLHYVNTVNLLRNRNYNLPIPTLRPTDLSQRPFFGVRPFPTVDQFTVRGSSSRDMYRAATISAQYRNKKVQSQSF